MVLGCIAGAGILLLQPYFMIVPFYGEMPFHDAVGKGLVGAIWASLLLAILIFFIPSFLRQYIPKKYRIIWFFCFMGMGLIVYGNWVYGEKWRFAALDVEQAHASITHINVDMYHLAKTGTRIRYRVEYEYLDALGRRYNASGTVHSGIMRERIIVGTKVPVSYLKGKPHVSRIMEPYKGKVVIVRTLFIVLGIMVMLIPIPFLLLQRYIQVRHNQRIDRWLLNKHHMKDGGK